MIKKYFIVVTLLFPLLVFSQSDDNVSAQANNPLANLTALNLQNYYVSKLTDAPENAYLNTFWVRFAQPFAKGKMLVRVSAPIGTVGIPTNNALETVDSKNGLGDINAFVTYNFVSKPSMTIGAGPLISTPSATSEYTGSGKWQGGLAAVAFIAKSPIFQWGGLVSWQMSFAGQEDRVDTNSVAIQPFYFWQLGKGAYLRGAPIWFFDFENNSFSVPVGLGIGKVVKVGNTAFNCFIEPQYTILHDGTQPQFQIYTSVNMQFFKKKE